MLLLRQWTCLGTGRSGWPAFGGRVRAGPTRNPRVPDPKLVSLLGVQTVRLQKLHNQYKGGQGWRIATRAMRSGDGGLAMETPHVRGDEREPAGRRERLAAAPESKHYTLFRHCQGKRLREGSLGSSGPTVTSPGAVGFAPYTVSPWPSKRNLAGRPTGNARCARKGDWKSPVYAHKRHVGCRPESTGLHYEDEVKDRAAAPRRPRSRAPHRQHR